MFFKHAGASFKSATDVVNTISRSSAAVSDENSNFTSNNGDSRESTADVAMEVDSPRSDNDNVQRSFSSDQEVNHSARADTEFRIISSIEESKEIVTQWKEGSGAFSLDIPLDMPAEIAKDLMNYFIAVGAACLLEGPNIKSILEKGLASAQYDLELASKNVANLQSLMHRTSSTDRKTDS